VIFLPSKPWALKARLIFDIKTSETMWKSAEKPVEGRKIERLAAGNWMQDTLQDLWPRSSRRTQTNKHRVPGAWVKIKNTKRAQGGHENYCENYRQNIYVREAMPENPFPFIFGLIHSCGRPSKTKDEWNETKWNGILCRKNFMHVNTSWQPGHCRRQAQVPSHREARKSGTQKTGEKAV